MSTVTLFVATTIAFSALIVTQKMTLYWLNQGIATLFLILAVAYIFVVATTYICIFMIYRQRSRIRTSNQCIKSNHHF